MWSFTSSSVSFCGSQTTGGLSGVFAQVVMRRNASASHQQVAHLGQGDELLVSWGAHVQADGQHLLQSRHDQRGLNGVELATPFLVPPLLVLASGLVREYLVLLSENSGGSILKRC